MKIALASDHAGFALKNIVRDFLVAEKHELNDFGPYTPESVDYPDYAHVVAVAVENGDYERGILLCGSANGVCITANKHQGIRAGLAWNVEVSDLIRRHNNANVLCLPARFLENEDAIEIVKVFLTTEFEGGRHATRVNKMSCSIS